LGRYHKKAGRLHVIQAEKLTMHYGPVVAVEDASFEVHPKEVVGLLGPNGAGKSTIMKILTTYLWPTSGTAKICGKDVLTEPIEVRRRIGYLPEVLPVYMDMEVGKYLDFVGRARGLSGSTLKTRLGWVTETCGLKAMFRTLIRELSKGYKQRTALAQALIHDPEVVILDEPTSGLDPHQIVQIRSLIRELAETKTVIQSTHILQEVQAVSDRIVIISQGHIVADGTLDRLREKATKRQRVEVAFVAGREDVQKALGGLMDATKLEFVKEDDGVVRFRVQADAKKGILGQINELAHNKNWEVRELLEMPLQLAPRLHLHHRVSVPQHGALPLRVGVLRVSPGRHERILRRAHTGSVHIRAGRDHADLGGGAQGEHHRDALHLSHQARRARPR
jgi:ABC-2 type transport system ATP-binding protein